MLYGTVGSGTISATAEQSEKGKGRIISFNLNKIRLLLKEEENINLLFCFLKPLVTFGKF